MDENVSSIILAIAPLFGVLFSAKLADTLGRKILILISLLGSGFGLSILASYLYLVQNGYDFPRFQWIPVTSLSFVVFISSAGISPLRSVVTVEHLPIEVCMKNTRIKEHQLFINCKFFRRFE